jgi:hypothetical protein
MKTTQFPHKLQCAGPDLIFSSGRSEIVKRFDVSAHITNNRPARFANQCCRRRSLSDAMRRELQRQDRVSQSETSPNKKREPFPVRASNLGFPLMNQRIKHPA